MVKIKSAIQLLFLMIWTILIIGVTLVTLLLTFRPTWVLVIVRKVWAPFILWVLRVDLEVKGVENIKSDMNYIFISNHTSYLDIPLLMVAIPRTFYFIAKRELIRVPFFGWMMWLLGMIFIDRKNATRSVKSMKLAAVKLKKGKNVLVFPEGTFDDHGQFLPFKKGTFHIAVKAKMPLLPLAISGANKVWPGHTALNLRKGKVTVNFGEVLVNEEEDDVKAIKALRDRGEEAVKALLD